MNKKIYELGFFYIVSAIIFVLLFFVFEPFLVPLFLAAVLASVFYPVHKRIFAYFKKKARLSAATSLVLIILLIIGPFVFVGSLLSSEALHVFESLSNNGFLETEYVIEKVNSVTSALPGFVSTNISGLDIENAVRSSVAPVLQNISGIFVSAFSFSFATVIFLIALYFFFKDGEELVKKTIILSPLPDQHDKKIADNLAKAFDTVIRGSVITALVQGALAVVGFLMVGSGAPLLLGSVAAIASLVPGIGASIIVVPVGLYFLVLGKYIAGTFLILWGIFVVGLSDNFLRPILFEKGIKVHPLIILLSILGGISFMGPIGVIAGPVLVSIAIALLEVHPYLLKQ